MGRRLDACCPTVNAQGTRDLDADHALAGFAKALAHPVRVAILRRLARQESCICGDIVSELALPQSTVSQHLKVLREAGLIRAEECGKTVGYRVAADGLRALRRLIVEL